MRCSNGRAIIEPDYWMFQASNASDPETFRCPDYFCPGHKSVGDFQCPLGRDQSTSNVLCARCESGHSYCNEECIPDSEIPRWPWAFVTLGPIAGVAAFHVERTNQTASSTAGALAAAAA